MPSEVGRETHQRARELNLYLDFARCAAHLDPKLNLLRVEKIGVYSLFTAGGRAPLRRRIAKPLLEICQQQSRSEPRASALTCMMQPCSEVF